MTALDIFFKLREAWEISTPSNNYFGTALDNVCKWDYQFYADGEFCFLKGDMVFTTPVINPFDAHSWRPNALLADGSLIEV